jgi:membrane protein YqaA with SNARE-associated domain
VTSGLGALFVGSILASTLLPGGVEGLLLLLVQQQDHSLLSLFLVATIGNTLGGVITFTVGILLRQGLDNDRHPRLRKWFSLDSGAVSRVRRHGTPILLLSWMPIVGDPLCVAGGFIGLRFWPAVLMIALGKAGRYLVLLWLLQKTI